jgi:thiosulfate sulfurtransferase
MNSISVAELQSALDSGNAPLVIDVRRQEAFIKDPETIAGALRREPDRVTEWMGGLPKTARMVVVCVHGHEVSQGVCRALAAQGYDAHFLEGGLSAWRAAGGPCDSKPDGA